eukprot:3475496-Rhodomonas_salina.1
MVSAKGEEEHIVRGLSLGCNDYLMAPYSTAELNARYRHGLAATSIQVDVQLRLKYLWHVEMQELLFNTPHSVLDLPAS